MAKPIENGFFRVSQVSLGYGPLPVTVESEG